MTINDSGRYIILELPAETLPEKTGDVVSSLIFAGIVPIIAHPERNSAIRSDPEKLGRLVEMGALAQLTAQSLTGFFGRKIQNFSIFLTEHKLVHMLVSDAHSVRQRQPVLSAGLKKRLKEVVGEKTALAMVETIPQKILNGEDCNLEYPKK